jgi:drug/metabolite transporter (DMT)-like permease
MVSISQKFGLKLLIKINRYSKAVLELTLAGIIWGASFTFVRWALEDFTATTLMLWRFVIAFVVGEIILKLFQPEQYRNSWGDARLAVWAGVFLGISLFFQTYGLNFTSATNSGFITSLYVVLIPIISFVFFRTKIHPRHIVFSLMAFAGMGLLLDLKEFKLEKGELLTLCAALTAAFQIMFIGRVAKFAKSPFRFNTYQTFWSCITLLPFLIYETTAHHVPLFPKAPSFRAIASVVCLALLVSVFAFYLQVRAQRVLSTTTSSMLCLLEGPFAFIFAALLLSERLNWVQAGGAAVILASCALSIYFDEEEENDTALKKDTLS